MVIETDRLVAAPPSDREDPTDRAIRPRRLDEYIGQQAVREQMEIFLSAARARGEPLDHTLIFGPPGLGKTTLASIIAEEMGVQLKTTSGPVLEKAGDCHVEVILKDISTVAHKPERLWEWETMAMELVDGRD